MGIPFPPTAERLEGMDETIAIVRGLFSGEPFAYQGKQWSVDSPGTFLPPVQQPRVPILLAGGGEKVTLRQVAQYADASNMGAHGSIGSAVSDDDIHRKFARLREYCEEFGRPFDAILRSQFTMPLVLGRSQQEIDQKLAKWPPETVASWAPPCWRLHRKRPLPSTALRPSWAINTSSPISLEATTTPSTCLLPM